MKTSVRRILATAVTAGAVGAAVLVPASPAMAIAHGCTIPGGNAVGCSTRSLPANSVEHAVLMTVFAAQNWVKVTCYTFDAASGAEVGRLSNSNIVAAKSKTIRGLYGRYFLSCVRAPHNSGGGGSISNG